MNAVRKRIAIVFAALPLVLVMTACGQRAQPVPTTDAPTLQTETAASRAAEGDIAAPADDTRESATASGSSDLSVPQPETPTAETTQSVSVNTQGEFGPLYQKYVRDYVVDGEYTVTMRQSGITMVTTVSGKDSALESNMAGVLHIRLINRDGNYFMLMESTKKYAEMTAEDYAKQADSLQNTTMDLSGVRYKSSGTETIAGKTYQTELYDEEGRGSVTYFFTDTGLARARVVKNGTTSEIESFTVRDAADRTMFDIPSDYVKVSDPSQLMT